MPWQWKGSLILARYPYNAIPFVTTIMLPRKVFYRLWPHGRPVDLEREEVSHSNESPVGMGKEEEKERGVS